MLLLVIGGCVVFAVATVAIIDSDRVRFGAPTTAKCSDCGELRRVVEWHNDLKMCRRCRSRIEGAMP